MLDVFDDPPRARARSRELMGHASKPVRAFGAMTFAAYFGEHLLALQGFRTIAPRLLGIQAMAIWRPLFKPMRQLPGFKDLVRELNLVTYWRTTGQWGEFARPVGEDDFEIVR
jgi:hypothetical protein